MNCIYSVTAINHTPSINPGETIKVEVYLHGTGVPDKSKLHIKYNPDLLNEESPGKVQTNVKKVERDGETVPIAGKDYKREEFIQVPGTVIGLVETMFHPHPEIKSSENLIPPVVAEWRFEGEAPIEYHINTDSARSGDYSLPIILTYENDDEIEQSREEVTVHVRSWQERHRKKLALVGLVIAIFSLILTILV